MSAETTSVKSVNFCESLPYPNCWNDEARVQVLLSPFRDRCVNPENYDSKMEFWQDTIKKYCFFKGKPNFCKQELQRYFTKGERVPCCFDMVLKEMLKKKLIRLRQDYEYDPENSWTGWAVNSFIRKPLYWGFDRMKVKLGVPDAAHLGLTQFIHLEVINEYCSELQDILFQPAYLGALHHYDKLPKDICPKMNISEECLRICLHTLCVRGKIGLEFKSTTKELQIHFIKIPSEENHDISITETDRAIHNLEVTKMNLKKQLEDLELEVKDNENKARQYIKENKKLLAKTFIRKKILLEKNHDRRSLALHNIETLLLNVHEAKLNGIILDAYKFGSKALQSVLEDSSLKYDNIDEVVSDVRETMDSFREVQDNLANANFDESLESVADEDELERELKEIMADTCTSIEKPIENNVTVGTPLKVDTTDTELLKMLNRLEIEESLQKADVNRNVLGS